MSTIIPTKETSYGQSRPERVAELLLEIDKSLDAEEKALWNYSSTTDEDWKISHFEDAYLAHLKTMVACKKLTTEEFNSHKLYLDLSCEHDKIEVLSFEDYNKF